MIFDDLVIGPDTRRTITELRAGQIRAFRYISGADWPTNHGFHCATYPDQVVELVGVDPYRVDKSVLRRTEPTGITVRITFGHMVFDHTNGAPGGPDWRPRPIGKLLPHEIGPYQAAIVYGEAKVTPNGFAARMYWSKPGVTADEFRADVLGLLHRNG